MNRFIDEEADDESPPRPFFWSWNSAAGRLEPVANERPRFIRPWHWGLAALVAAAGLIYGSLLPFRFQALTLSAAWREFQRLWADGLPSAYSSQDVAVNVLVAVPLAFSLMGMLLLHRRRTLELFVGTMAMLGICFVVSCGVEFAQLWIDTRVSSVRDVAAQLVGAAIGGMLWLACGSELSQRLDEFLKSREPASRVVWLLNAYLIGLVIWSLLPFDLVTSIEQIGRKYRRGQIEIVPFTFPFSTRLKFWYGVLAQAALFVPVGIWSMTAWVRRRSPLRNPWSALAICLGVNAAIELAQLLLKSRYTSSTDVLMGTAGCAVGITGMQWRAWRRGKVPAGAASMFGSGGFWFLASLAYAALLLAIGWAPFEFTRDQAVIRERLRNFADLPFKALQASGSDVDALFHVIRNFGWYVPLGVLAALAAFQMPFPRSRWLTVGGAALLVAAVAFLGELGQILLPGTVADLTEALVRAAGGLAGLGMATAILRRWSPE